MAGFKLWASVAALVTGPTATLVLFVVGLPGTVSDAMTWLGNWLPAIGSFFWENVELLGPAWLVSAVGLALLVGIHLPDIRLRLRSTKTKAISSQAIEANGKLNDSAMKIDKTFNENPNSLMIYEEDSQAKIEIAAFVVDHILPASSALKGLHAAIVGRLCNASAVRSLALKGLEISGGGPDYHRNIKLLIHGTKHGKINLSLEAMVKAVEELSYLYPAETAKLSWLCSNTEYDFRFDPDIATTYKKWIDRDSALSSAYKDFLRDYRFPSLNDLKQPRPGKAFISE